MATDATVRTHVLLPHDVIERIDRCVGQRRRSQFIADAAREKLARLNEEHRREERSAAARAAFGSLAGRHIPEWDTPESADGWIREMRTARDPWRDAAQDQP